MLAAAARCRPCGAPPSQAALVAERVAAAARSRWQHAAGPKLAWTQPRGARARLCRWPRPSSCSAQCQPRTHSHSWDHTGRCCRTPSADRERTAGRFRQHRTHRHRTHRLDQTRRTARPILRPATRARAPESRQRLTDSRVA
eukprot:4419235-Prymnesium_polylepis.1